MKKKKTLIASLKKVLKAFGGEDTKSNNAVDLISEIADNISTSGSGDPGNYITKDNPMLTEYYNYDWVKIGEDSKAVYFVNDNILADGWETNMAQLDGSNTYARQLAIKTRQASYATTIAQLKNLPKYIQKLWDLGYMIPHDSSADGQLYILIDNYLFLIQYSGISGVSIAITLRRLNDGACLRSIQYNFQADTITSGTTDYLKVYTSTVTPNKYVKTNADGFPALVDDTKLESNQGTENAGKYLGISATGEVEPQAINSSPLLVHYALNTTTSKYEADYTFAQIRSAIDQRPVYVIYDNKYVPFAGIVRGENNEEILLFRVYQPVSYLGYADVGYMSQWYQISIDANDVITVSEI